MSIDMGPDNIKKLRFTIGRRTKNISDSSVTAE